MSHKYSYQTTVREDMNNMVESVIVKPLVLLNIADQVNRKSKSKYGVLVGSKSSNQTIITTSFELLLDSCLVVDSEFLYQRYQQFLQVDPSVQYLGIYQIHKNVDPELSIVSVMQQTTRILSLLSPEDSLFLIFNTGRVNHDQRIDELNIKIYSLSNEFTKVSFKIEQNDVDSVVLQTIEENSQNLEKKEFNKGIFTARGQTENSKILSSLQIWSDKLNQILQVYSDLRRFNEISDDDRRKMNNSVVKLSFLLDSLKFEPISVDNISTSMTKLSMLTSQVLTTNNLEIQNMKSLYQIRNLQSTLIEDT